MKNEDDELSELRNQIDKVDSQILEKLKIRTDLVEQVSVVKKKVGLKPYQPTRFNELLDNLEEQAQKIGVDPILVRRVWYAIHSYSVEQQGGSIKDVGHEKFSPM